MSERDLIDVAREVWPELEWTGGLYGGKVGASTEPSPDLFVLALRLEDGRERVRVEFAGAVLLVNTTTPPGGLRSALTEARRLTLARLEAAAAKCREPYPVQVERHRKTGEAVLFLTSPHNGEVMAIARYLLDAEPDIRELGDGTTAIRIGKFGGLTNMYSVTEPAEAIRETLRMLAEEGGA